MLAGPRERQSGGSGGGYVHDTLYTHMEFSKDKNILIAKTILYIIEKINSNTHEKRMK